MIIESDVPLILAEEWMAAMPRCALVLGARRTSGMAPSHGQRPRGDVTCPVSHVMLSLLSYCA